MDRTWHKNYQLAKKYYIKHGNLLIPEKYEIEGVKLGYWITNLRRTYKNGTISQFKIDKLNEIGMVWVGRIYNDQCNKKNDKKFNSDLIDLKITSDNQKMIKKEILIEFNKHLKSYQERTIKSKEDIDKINEEIFPRLK